MTRKIKFIVIFTTDEDPDFPASELNSHGPTVHGWRSNKNYTAYPQELILKFQSPAAVSRIQVLGHQFMIPEKIELWLHNDTDKDTPTTPSTQSFEYLGFITLSDNATTNYKSRELQSVAVEPKVGTHLKLRLSSPYQNELNETGQISLLAVNVLGEDAGHLGDTFTSICDDLSFCMYVEEGITEIIRELEAKKLKAVADERFEYAKKLKLCMTALGSAGERLGRYALAKRQAVAQEDFITAKLRKEQIRMYQESVFNQLEVEKLLEKEGFNAENDAVSTVYSTKPILPSPPSLQNVAGLLMGLTSSPKPVRSDMQLMPDAHEVLHSPQLSKLGRNSNRSSPSGSLRRRNRSIPRNLGPDDHEERSLPGLRTSLTNEFLRDCQGYGYDGDRDPPRGRSKLNDRERRQSALPITIFGNELVEEFYSKHFQDREDGLTRLRTMLKEDTFVAEFGANKVARAAVVLLYRSVRDAVFSVFSQVAETIRILFSEFIPRHKVSPSGCVDKLLPELLAKSGDPSARIHTLAQHTILSIAICPEVQKLNLVAPSLSRPVGSASHPRLAMSRLQMLEQLVLTVGISPDKQSGLTCRILAEAGISGINHPTEGVRKIAERVLLLVYKVNRRLVRKMVPPDDDVTRRNLMYRQLFQEFDKIDLEKKNEHSNGGGLGGGSSGSAGNTEEDLKGLAANGGNGVDEEDAAEEEVPTGVSCPFCDEMLCETEDLDKHYWKACPLLTKCPQCSLVLEVQSFSAHLINECEAKNGYMRCELCTESVHRELFQLHREEDYCKAIPSKMIRCPLCHENITSSTWKNHYLDYPGCVGNSKRRVKK